MILKEFIKNFSSDNKNINIDIYIDGDFVEGLKLNDVKDKLEKNIYFYYQNFEIEEWLLKDFNGISIYLKNNLYYFLPDNLKLFSVNALNQVIENDEMSFYILAENEDIAKDRVLTYLSQYIDQYNYVINEITNKKEISEFIENYCLKFDDMHIYEY